MTELLANGPRLVSKDLLRKLYHVLRIHIAHNAEDHIARGIEGTMAGVQRFRCDATDTLGGAENGDTDGVLFVHDLRQLLEDPGIGGIGVHADLLIDDAHFPLDAFLREVGGGHEFQQ